MRVTVVVPALDEAATIARTLLPLQPWRGPACEIVLVDGGSRDATVAIARPLVDRVLIAAPGRAAQMNAGAAGAASDALWFLHADTVPPHGALPALRDALARGGWGRFDVRIAGRHPLLRLVARAMNLRSRLTGVATGDQGIFVARALFTRAGGFPELPLMEDVALSLRLRRLARPRCLPGPLVTSGRRWERNGVLSTIALMWWLRLAYRLGVAPATLVSWYGRG